MSCLPVGEEGTKMAEDMILEVKKNVAREIESKINNNIVPELIREFLQGPWTEVMKIIGLRDACQGKGWNAALKLVDELIWSVRPKLVVKDRQELLSLIPQILQTLQNGLMLIYFEPHEIEMFFKKLEKLHLSCMRIESSVKIDHLEVQSNSERQTSQAIHDEVFKEIVNQSNKHDTFQSDITNPQLRNSPYFEAVQSMAAGTWVEFKHFEGSKRGKLVWKCDFTGEFTFLDRRFKVIADVNLRDLIRQFELGKARIVNDIPFLDRAVDAIVNGMKHYANRDSHLAQVTN